MTSGPNDLEAGEIVHREKKMPKMGRPRRSTRHIPDGFHFLLDGKPHPLLIPSIVSEVAAYLGVPDLKVFRQVCTQWNDEAHKELRKKVKIVLQGEESVIEFTKFNSNVSKFYLNFELRGDLELGEPSVQKFFQLFGDKMKYVCFNRVKWREHELKDLLFEKLPNLEELGLEARAYSDRRLFPGGSDSHELVTSDVTSLTLPKIRVLRLNIFSYMAEVTAPFLRDVLRASPNVEVISSLKTSKISNPLPMPFIQYICQAMNYDTADDLVNMPFAADIAIADAILDEKGSSLSKLACVECNMRLRATGLNLLARKAYPLRQLDLTVMSDVTSATLKQLLDSVQGTLEVLKLKFQPGCYAAEDFSTPEMNKLTQLTLNGFKGSLKFLEKLPHLKRLTFIRINLQKSLAKEAVLCRHSVQIESFQVFEELSMDGLAADTIRLLAMLFPRLRSLKLENLCDESLVQLFEEFSLLEDLDALNGFYTDSGITGIKKSVFESSQNTMDVLDFHQYKENPEISCLENLRSLCLGSPKITDYSILYGVTLCKNLRRLHLISYGITDKGLLRLSSELDLFYLKTEYCFQFSTAAVQHVTKKMKGRQLSLNEYTGPMRQNEIPKFMRRNWNASVRLNKLEISQIPHLRVLPPIVSDTICDTESSQSQHDQPF